jgi:hypothetical protein
MERKWNNEVRKDMRAVTREQRGKGKKREN